MPFALITVYIFDKEDRGGILPFKIHRMHIKSSTSKRPHNPPSQPPSSSTELTRKFDGLSITEKLNTLFTKDMLTKSTSANLDYLKKLARFDLKLGRENQGYRDELRFWLTVDKAL